MQVCYYERKNDYFNIAYRMWGDDSYQEKDVPHSPKSEVSDSEIFPTMVDNFENEIENPLELRLASSVAPSVSRDGGIARRISLLLYVP